MNFHLGDYFIDGGNNAYTLYEINSDFYGFKLRPVNAWLHTVKPDFLLGLTGEISLQYHELFKRFVRVFRSADNAQKEVAASREFLIERESLIERDLYF